MPIELRPSDVAFQKARAYQARSTSQGGADWMPLLAQVVAVARDRERVSEVNAGLATQLEFWPREREDFSRTPFEITPQAPATRQGLPPAIMAPIKKNLGEVTFEDVLERHSKAVQALADDINRTVRNRQAREELLQHLAAGSAQQTALLLADYKAASQDHALVGLGELTKATLTQVKELGWEEVLRRIGIRTGEMVKAGQMKETEAAKYLDSVQAQAQYVQAYNGSLQAMNTGGPEAGQKYLEQNTPYWEAEPGLRAKVLQDVRQEWEYQGKTRDEASDRVFADLHIRAETPEAVDLALGKLKTTNYFNGDQKYIWEQRFEAKKANLLNAQTVPKSVLEDFYKENEDRVWAQLAFAKAKGIPLGSLRQMVEDAYYGRDKEGTGIPRVRGAFVKAAYEYLEAKEDPVFTSGIKYIESRTAALNDKDKARVTNEFRAWMQVNPNANAKTIETAANNLVKPVIQRNIDRWGRRTWEVLWGDKKVLDEFELLTRDIEEGKYIGLAPNRQEYLARYNAYIVGLAQRDFPDENIASVFTDFTGEYGGKPGTAILVSAANNAYAYKLEGKALTLYRLAKTRAGTYTWQQVVKPGTAKATESIEKQEKAAAAEAARKEREQAGIEYARSRLPGGVPLIQEETP